MYANYFSGLNTCRLFYQALSDVQKVNITIPVASIIMIALFNACKFWQVKALFSHQPKY